MEDLSFLTKRYVGSGNAEQRLQTLEKYINRQNTELYVLINRMERRLETVERKLALLEKK